MSTFPPVSALMCTFWKGILCRTHTEGHVRLFLVSLLSACVNDIYKVNHRRNIGIYRWLVCFRSLWAACGRDYSWGLSHIPSCRQQYFQILKFLRNISRLYWVTCPFLLPICHEANDLLSHRSGFGPKHLQIDMALWIQKL